MKRHRNPGSSSTLPLLLVGAGVGLFLLGKRQSAGVNGVGALGFSLHKAFKKATHTVSQTVKAVERPITHVSLKDAAVFAAGGGIAHAVVAAADVAKHAPSSVIAAATGGASAMGLNKIVRTVMKGKRQPAPPPGSNVVYQDENGKVITRGEYERRQALYEAQSACYSKGWNWNGTACVAQPGSVSPQQPVIDYGPSSGQSFAQPPADQSAMYPSSSGGSSGGSSGPSGSDYGPPPDASAGATADQSLPMDPPPAPPAPAGKISPLVAVATFAAVPLLLGLTGEH